MKAIGDPPHTTEALRGEGPRPICDICTKGLAVVDGKTKMGPWAYMCKRCYKRDGIGLGMGLGQYLIMGDEHDPQ